MEQAGCVCWGMSQALVQLWQLWGLALEGGDGARWAVEGGQRSRRTLRAAACRPVVWWWHLWAAWMWLHFYNE